MINWKKIPLEGKDGLIEVLKQIPDPRERRGIRHPAVVILSIAVCATLSGARTFKDISAWGKQLKKRQLQRMGGWRDTPPSLSTIQLVLSMFDPEIFDTIVYNWLIRNNIIKKTAIALDGKTLKGSRDGASAPIHLLSAVLHQEGIVIGQKNVGEKTNEIPVARDLLKPMTIEGSVVTADAMHTQRETAKQIFEKNKADYVLTVKDNQPTLKFEIEHVGNDAFSP